MLAADNRRAGMNDAEARRAAVVELGGIEPVKERNRDFGKTIVMVTHDAHAARYATNVRHLEKGRLLERDRASLTT
jgi:ABC-type lipoprotein export system ATPase subunit